MYDTEYVRAEQAYRADRIRAGIVGRRRPRLRRDRRARGLPPEML